MINYIFYLPLIEKFETLRIQKYKKCFLPTEPWNSNFDNSRPWKRNFDTWGPRKSNFEMTEMTGNWQSRWILNFLTGVSFFRLLMLIMFFAENNFFSFGLILLSSVSGVFGDSVKLTWPLPICHLLLKFLFWNCKSFKSRPFALEFPLKTICSYKKPNKGKIFICAESCFISLNKC